MHSLALLFALPGDGGVSTPSLPISETEPLGGPGCDTDDEDRCEGSGAIPGSQEAPHRVDSDSEYMIQ